MEKIIKSEKIGKGEVQLMEFNDKYFVDVLNLNEVISSSMDLSLEEANKMFNEEVGFLKRLI